MGQATLIIERLDYTVLRIPTDAPEADGTLTWNATTLIVVFIKASGVEGMGYTYADAACARLFATLEDTIVGEDGYDIPALMGKLRIMMRNNGHGGLVACALSAIDLALWDLKARALTLPLCRLLGMARRAVPIYGSGGFTTYSDAQLAGQLAGWVERDGCGAVKMKVGTDPARDPYRIATAREAIGRADLFIDANGAFTPAEAVRFATGLSDYQIKWFEEPVTSDDPAGLAFVRGKAPASMEIAAGEYAYSCDDATRLLTAGAVDVLQADATRCGGVSGFLAMGTLCESAHLDLSGHCAPSIHLHLALTVPRLRHLEWFHDHVRIEQMVFDGAPEPEKGMIFTDLTRTGHGLELRRNESERFRI
ncbi:mandelate racemase [Allorhizobium sp. BGMRC 0089]|uniref:enolase C-terminal domain-like protein n=1 Tax=Allorhizobium sonneratiae TaxID=2934936 RepID=UPI0020333F0B|nr:enolase C-terminal domain-like protein [Allorhizobium sonneratiae]MCM2294589.1 mandelate racemase [Allorhizobium sonneratiae]